MYPLNVPVLSAFSTCYAPMFT